MNKPGYLCLSILLTSKVVMYGAILLQFLPPNYDEKV